MAKDDGEANKTLESPNPDGETRENDPDSPNLAGPGDSQIGEGIERGARVSGDGDGDDMSVTLAQLSSKKVGKKQLKSAAEEDSKSGDGVGDEDDSVALRRSRRKRVVVDSGDGSKRVNLDGDGEEEERNPEAEEEEEDEEEEESEFSVGDFVWGKVKSHPWWPGRVFDPADASEQALKYKNEGRILVAYFGDATFAWCDASQLQPFVENFAEMSKQSESKGFVNAVEEAVSEFGRLVELDMACYCTPRSSEGSAHHQTSALNAGIKGGVNVNKGGIGIYSVDRFDPAAFLADLRIVGKHGSVGNLLELTTLKSWVSAVYRSKDGPLLLKFNELQEAAENEGVEAGIEDSVRGPVDEPFQVISGMSDPLVSSKRKVRSVAEIVYGDEKGNEDDAVVEGEKGVKKKKLEDVLKGETEAVKKEGRRSSSMKAKARLKPVVVESDLAAAFEESEMTPRTRERKVSKYLSPPYANIEYYRKAAITSPRGPAETKAAESSHVSQSKETSSKPASAQVSGSTSGKTLKEKLPKEVGAEHGKSNGSVPATPRRASSRKVVGNPTKNIASPNNVLSGIRSAARSGSLSKGNQSLKAVKGFLTSYRSSKYQNESSCIPSEADNQSGEKGESDLEVPNELRKSVKKSETMPDKAKLKNKKKEADIGKDGKITGAPQPTALYVKFPPGYKLPSKDDLGGLFGKFGELDTSKTKVSIKTWFAQLVFVRGSDAVNAYKSSKASNPFGKAKVTYRIGHLRGTSKEKKADENGFSKEDPTKSGSKRTRSSKKQGKASASDGGLRLVKQKLDGMATMVAEAGDGKMSIEIKSDLESRLKELLDEVKALPALPSASGSGV